MTLKVHRQENCQTIYINRYLNEINNMFSATHWRNKVEIVEKQEEMRDWASGYFNLFSLREAKCGGEGHRETKHTAHKQHSWRNHWNIALCFLGAIIGPGAFFPFPLSLFLSLALSFSAHVFHQYGAVERPRLQRLMTLGLKGTPAVTETIHNTINTEKYKQTYGEINHSSPLYRFIG